MSSETPRTDKEEFEAMGVGCEGDPTYSTFKAVESTFARQLERELAAKDAELAELRVAPCQNLSLWVNHLLGTIELPLDRMREEIERPLKTELSESRAQVARLREGRDAVIAGALYDLMGWLTTRRTRLCLSDKDLSGPAVDALVDWAKMRGFSLDSADVKGWQSLAPLPEQSARDAKVLRAAEELSDVAKRRNDDCLTGALITPEIDAIHEIIQAVRGESSNG